MFESKQKERELKLKRLELDLNERKFKFDVDTDSRVDIPLKELEELKAENQRLKEKSDALEKFCMNLLHSIDAACDRVNLSVEEVIHAVNEGKAEFVDCVTYKADPLNRKSLLVLKLEFDAR